MNEIEKIADLERQLAECREELESETAWAHEYHSRLVEAERLGYQAMDSANTWHTRAEAHRQGTENAEKQLAAARAELEGMTTKAECAASSRERLKAQLASRDAAIGEAVKLLERIEKQRPSKPDYWSSCGQCEHNSSDAEDVLIELRKVAIDPARSTPTTSPRMMKGNGMVGSLHAFDHAEISSCGRYPACEPVEQKENME